MFLNLGISDAWDQMILCHEGFPVHRRLFHSVPAPYSLETTCTIPPSTVTTKTISRH